MWEPSIRSGGRRAKRSAFPDLPYTEMPDFPGTVLQVKKDGGEMDMVQTMQHGLAEIRADWQASSLDEKQNYVLELGEMAAEATAIRSISGTMLLRDVGLLRDAIERQILPAQHKRDIDARQGEQELPGAKL